MNGVLRGRWDAFLDQAVLAANERGAAGLIVDIRKNSGGSSSLGDALIARLTDRPYRMAAGAVWRRSPESDETFSMMAKPEWRWLTVALPIFLPNYTRLRQGEDLTEMVDVASRPRAEPAFRRPAVLLIGDETASSAMMLADAARTFDLMLTIGQPTGGLPNSLGDVGPFQLPNSKIPVSFSQKLFIRASGDASDLGPVRPHIEVAPIAGSDSALERAILEIRRMNASSHAFGVSGG
jgi:C-terminal processing protease CtpA/Prc